MGANVLNRTYCQNQREKPLKVCVKCQRPWYMTSDVCMECEDKYLLQRAKENQCDVQSNYMGGYGE